MLPSPTRVIDQTLRFIGLIVILVAIPNVLFWWYCTSENGRTPRALAHVGSADSPKNTSTAVLSPSPTEKVSRETNPAVPTVSSLRSDSATPTMPLCERFSTVGNGDVVAADPFLWEIRQQSCRHDFLERVSNASLHELWYIRDRVDAMLHFLRTRFNSSGEEEMKHLLSRMELQSLAVENWITLRRGQDGNDTGRSTHRKSKRTNPSHRNLALVHEYQRYKAHQRRLRA